MTDQKRSFEDRTMDICPYFTVAEDDQGQAAHQIPSGYYSQSSLPGSVEVPPGTQVTFSLRAHDPKGRGVIFELRGLDVEKERKSAASDETVTFTWTPAPGRLRHQIIFMLFGDYEGQHREGSADQAVSFSYQTFPDS